MAPTVVVIMPKPVHAQALYVLYLERPAANLAGPYAGILGGLNAALGEAGVIVDRTAVLPLYGSVTATPQLLWGQPAPAAGDLFTTLGPAATSGNFDTQVPGATAEQYNVATVAAALDSATLPGELTNGQSAPFFAPPDDLFLIVTLSGGPRACALGDGNCKLQGASPVDYFASETGGKPSWLKLPGGTYAKSHVYQVFITTSEGESPEGFRARCGAMPGFPKTLLDVMSPSPLKYYGDLATGLAQKGWHAEAMDLCPLLGADGPTAIQALAKRIAPAAM